MLASCAADAFAIDPFNWDALNLLAFVGATINLDLIPGFRTKNKFLYVLAKIVLLLARYDLSEASKAVEALNDLAMRTPTFMCLVGRLKFELVDYKGSYRAFRIARELDTTRAKDMDYFSTLLWHLKKHAELSFLAHDLIDMDRSAPEGWVALGNALSLENDEEGSRLGFQRAAGLAPRYAYAYTLLGHEYVSAEDYESALKYFRLALRYDARHYNAWYGIGMVFLKQGRPHEGYENLQIAANINPCNAVLECCVGMAQEKLNQEALALAHYSKAVRLQPKSTLARYKKSRALVSIGKYNAALEDLKVLQHLATEEANVHFLLGTVYQNLKDYAAARKEFTYALGLDPKGAHLIKEALESMATS
ncbi:hypothetical protein CANCADRAFT_29491 [Tortispora caseinolytica NRRL Y-17796]|uniref:Uncharacterized protein n=1 Tax=Tortispora caseinolytica NRRL Y-17796 TaxID=767744 RepID=A0A1E4TC80_9ASCO|nr:hypothetical protein CANCADRAFT_29491 [Tortispora caseinolytica NRRL Y-17796]